MERGLRVHYVITFGIRFDSMIGMSELKYGETHTVLFNTEPIIIIVFNTAPINS